MGRVFLALFITGMLAGPSGCMRYGYVVGDDGAVDQSLSDNQSVDSNDAFTDAGVDANVIQDVLPSDFDGPIQDGPISDGPVSDAPVQDGPSPPDLWVADQPLVSPPDAPVPDLPLPPDALIPDLPVPPDAPIPDLTPPPDMAVPDQPQPDQNLGPLWWNPSYPHRLRLTLTNSQTAAWYQEPFFIAGSQLSGASGIRESTVRVVRWDGSSHTEIPFALHDWSSGLAALDDSDGVLDSDDELLFLVNIPAGGTAEYQIYYDTVDHTPASHANVTVSSGGSGFPRVTVDGTMADRGYLRFTDGVAVFDLMLTDSIPFWNHTNNYTFESSAIGPRINDMKLPSGDEVFATVNHTTGNGTGKLTHTIRLGPFRLDGNFSLLSSSQAFYGARLVSSVAHSKVTAWSRPIAAVVVIDAEFYCDEPSKCSPAEDYGDVRLVGYLFNRGSQNEVLMRWRVQAQMNGTNTISATSSSSDSEFYNLVSYMIEDYCEKQHSSEIDLDTTRVKEQGTGTVSSVQFDNSSGDKRLCKNTDQWILMSDTDSPYKGVISLLPEGSPMFNGTAATWRGCWWGDGNSGIELNGFQTEWHLSPSAFSSWGTGSSDAAQYSYWIYGFERTPDDQTLANTRAARIQNPPGVTVAKEP